MSTITITVTESALKKLEANRPNPNDFIRISIQGGGCSGLSYAFELTPTKEEGDVVICDVILVDSISFQYLEGAEIDYTEDLMSAQFVIRNPNAKSTCGCGESFNAQLTSKC